ncbi:MAG: HEAT repeat domain-containing protein [Acidobacteriia bacterium]|nr:HEAT repeat domain-containing protein [Terriglobia bacterium]
MINHVGRMLTLRREEAGPASLLFFYLFLVMGAYMMGQAVGDALFLHVYPTQLPYAMIGSALMSALFVAVYARLSTRMRLENLIVAALVFLAISFAFFWWLMRFQYQWVYWLVLIWVYTVGAIGPMMGWTLANYTVTTREARRIYGLVGAGALLGGAIVSFTTADAVRHERMQPKTAFLVMALLLVLCTVLVKLLFRNAGQRLAAVNQSPVAGDGAPKTFGQNVTLIHSSRYLLMLTALIAVGCLATSILGYQFKLIGNAHYGEDTVGFVNYMARFNGYMGLASFVFQLTLTPVLLSTFGIRVTLFVVPVALMGTSMGLLAAPTLLMASILRGTHYMLRFSLDKSSTELLYVPVSPAVRSQVKSFIDTFVWRSADGVAGLILVLFARVLKFDPGQVSLVNMVALVAWIYIANEVRREYLNVLRQAIARRTLDPERTAAQVLDSTTIEVLAQALERGGEQQLMYGMSLFEMSRQTGWHPALRRLLDHRSPAVRQQALRLLGDAGDREILPRVEELLGDESLEVRAEALRYLVVHAGRDPLMLQSGGSDLPAYVIQGAVVTYLARSAEEDYSSAAMLILESMLSQVGPEAVPARCEAARVLGVIPSPSELHNHLLELMHDENPEVAEQALLSAGKNRIRELLPVVIEKLGQPQLVAAARTALVQYDRRAVGMLQSCLSDPTLPLPIRKQIPQTLARIPNAESASALAHSLVQSDPGLRYDVLKALNQLRDRDPELIPGDVDYADMVNAELIGYYRSFQILAALETSGGKAGSAEPHQGGERLLRRAFREHMDHELERIFRMLALLYSPRDVHNAFAGLTSGRPQLRANALEMLEHLLQPDLYRRLASVLDPEIDSQQRLAFARRFCGTEVTSRNEALRILLHSEDCWLRACALYAVGRLRLSELSPDLDKVPCDRDPLLSETRTWALARLALDAQA